MNIKKFGKLTPIPTDRATHGGYAAQKSKSGSGRVTVGATPPGC
ncbi:hypothetical protein ACFLUA_03480 [Chloroflexota bacterium]